MRPQATTKSHTFCILFGQGNLIFITGKSQGNLKSDVCNKHAGAVTVYITCIHVAILMY